MTRAGGSQRKRWTCLGGAERAEKAGAVRDGRRKHVELKVQGRLGENNDKQRGRR